MTRLLASVALVGVLAGPVAAEETIVAQVRLVDAVAIGPSVEARLEIIRRRIQAALVYPDLARHHGQAGDVRVRFLIGGDGAAEDVETAGSSGIWLLDRAAERSVRDAAPLPYVWGRLEVPVRFDIAGER